MLRLGFPHQGGATMSENGGPGPSPSPQSDCERHIHRIKLKGIGSARDRGYISHNDRQRMLLYVTEPLAPDEPFWSCSDGGHFVGASTGPEVIWEEDDDWYSSEPNDVTITATTSDWTVTCHWTIFRINEVSYEVGLKETHIVTVVQVSPEKPDPAKIEAIMNKAPTAVGADAKNGIKLTTRKFVEPFDQVIKQPLLPDPQGPGQPHAISVCKIRNLRHRFNNGNEGSLLVAEIESDTVPGDVDVVWENVAANLAEHRVHVNVRACDEFKKVTFDKADVDCPAETKPGKAVVENEDVPANAVIGLISTSALPFKPKITIHTDPANDHAKAKEYEVGFAQAVLERVQEATYVNAGTVFLVPQTPVKDGAGGNKYDPVFVKKPPSPGEVQPFTHDGETITLTMTDQPSQFLPYSLALLGPILPPNTPNAKMAAIVYKMKLRTWIVVRHIPTGCLKRLRHIDWEIDYKAAPSELNGKVQAVIDPAHSSMKCTAAGDGSPSLLIGGPVANYLNVFEYKP
jgi:hypothetical protein